MKDTIMDTIDNLLNVINKGFDGIVRDIKIHNLKEAEIEVSVRTLKNEWVNVLFKMSDVKEFKIAQKIKTSNIVMSMGICVMRVDGIYYIDFSPYSELIESLDDIRKSDIYFGVGSIEWQIKPYHE